VRPTLDQFALSIADAAATRSEDPKYQVGATVLGHDGRVLGVGYNGPPPGVDLFKAEWISRDIVRPLIVHAETNALIGIRPDEAGLLATTLGPCARCIGIAARLGIKRIVSRDPIPRKHMKDSLSAISRFGIIFKVIGPKPAGGRLPTSEKCVHCTAPAGTFDGIEGGRPACVCTTDCSPDICAHATPIDPMDVYQVATRRTGGYPSPETRIEHLTQAALGLAGESGEIADEVKKILYHGREIDTKALALEAGDVLWYLARFADTLGIPLSEVAKQNLEKLWRRYPEGFVKGGGKR